jgi:hypothetical protein
MTEEQKAQEQKEQDRNASDKGGEQRERMIPKSRFDEVNQQKKEALAELQSVADSLREEIPEDKRDLIPDLPPAQLIQWLRKASKAGLFSVKAIDPPDGGKRPNSKQTQDLTGLSPQSIMSMGYGKK